MKKRLFQFDFIRSVAALSVVIIHTTSTYVTDNEHAYILNQAVRYAVPIFIMISGFLLYLSDKQKNKVNYAGFLAKRLKKILIPYFIWTVAYDIFYNRHDIISLFTKEGLFDFIRYLTTGLDHLYFIVIILQLYLLYPLIKPLFIKGYGILVLSLSFLCSLYFQLGAYLMSWDILILPKAIWNYNYLLFPCWIFYFVLGMYLSYNQTGWKKVLSNQVNILILWFLCLIIYIVDSKITNTFELSIKPLVMVYTVLSFFLFYIIANPISKINVFNKFFTWLSEQSFLFYLSHILIMRISFSAAYKIGFNTIWDSTQGMILYQVVTVMNTLIFVYLVSLTSFAPMLGGVKMSKQKIIISNEKPKKEEIKILCK